MLGSGKFPNLRVVLVHGTWGRGFLRKKPLAPWCHRDSVFVTNLLAECNRQLPNVTTDVAAFSWSGSNSVFERAKAAAALAVDIETYPSDSAILVIAHSHGGNVAMQATLKVRDSSNVFVATLATPFLKLFEIDRSYRYSLATLRFFVFSVLIWVDQLIWRYVLDLWRPKKIDADERKPIDNTLEALESLKQGLDELREFYEYLHILDWRLNWSLISLFVFGLIAWYLGTQLHLLLINPRPRKQSTNWQLKPKHLTESTMWDARAMDNRLLVLRGVDDEAALSLAAGAIANRLLRVFYQIIFSARVMIAVAIFGVLAFASLIIFSDTLLGVFQIVYFVLLCVAAGCLMLPSMFRPVFGRELAFGAIRCDASFESAPDTDRAKIVTLHDELGSKGLIHSIHQHPDVPSVIVHWIANTMQCVDSRQVIRPFECNSDSGS